MKRKTIFRESLRVFALSVVFLIILYLINASKKTLLIIILILGLSLAGMFISSLSKIINQIQSKSRKLTKDSVKFAIYLIPIMIILYLLYMNISPFGHVSNVFYDIGSEEDILAPQQRVSDNTIENETSFQNLEESLVYFDISPSWRTKEINVEVKFRNDFPKDSEDYVFNLCAKDEEEWHYKCKPVYSQFLQNLKMDPKATKRLYQVNNASERYPDIESFMENPPKNSVIATFGVDMKQKPAKNTLDKKELVVDTALRGSLTLYTYAEGDLILEISKQDLNWYENEDELEIEVYDSEDNLISNMTIGDDGVINASKEIKQIQSKELIARTLKEGLYRIELKNNGDLIIRKIIINQNRLVVKNRIFLVATDVYIEGIQKQSNIYFKTYRNTELSFKTWHEQAFQTIRMDNELLNINKREEEFKIAVEPSEYLHKIISDKNDIIIEGPVYFSFTEDSYFEPFEYKVVALKSDMKWLKNNVDYILMEYKKPIIDGDWIIGETTFNIEEDNLYIKDNKLSMMLNVPHLAQEEYKNHTIPVDWIKITSITPPLIK